MGDDAETAYQAFAPIYDAFNHRNDYEMWCGVLLAELEERGLRRGRLFDVGCGTGMAFEPMLRRGWEIRGCDLSSAMLDAAREKFGDRVPVFKADMRELPTAGEFELVWALNDVVNYLVDDGDLERALAGMRANLAADGLVLFDANALALYRSNFMSSGVGDIHDRGWRWQGLADEVEAGCTYEARLSGEGVESHIHRSRHYPANEVREAMEAAGLEPLAVLGQREADGRVVLSEPVDEIRDHKIVFIGRRS